MSQVINWWGDLPPPMKEAIEQFRTQLGAAIDSVDLSKGHSTEKYTKLTAGKATLMFATVHQSGYGTEQIHVRSYVGFRGVNRTRCAYLEFCRSWPTADCWKLCSKARQRGARTPSAAGGAWCRPHRPKRFRAAAPHRTAVRGTPWRPAFDRVSVLPGGCRSDRSHPARDHRPRG